MFVSCTVRKFSEILHVAASVSFRFLSVVFWVLPFLLDAHQSKGIAIVYTANLLFTNGNTIHFRFLFRGSFNI